MICQTTISTSSETYNTSWKLAIKLWHRPANKHQILESSSEKMDSELSLIKLDRISHDHLGIAIHQEIVLKLEYRNGFMQKSDSISIQG